MMLAEEPSFAPAGIGIDNVCYATISAPLSIAGASSALLSLARFAANCKLEGEKLINIV